MSNHNKAPASPDTKKKKPAFPSLFSNFRNAQAVIGRASDDLHEREIRPLVGGGGGSRMPAFSNQPQLHRTVQSTSLSSTVQNLSERFGSQWIKRGRRKKGSGVTIVPQNFFIAVGCFFVAFPIFLIIYILARHAVFGDEGDEGDNTGSLAHVHEVPSSFVSGIAFESGEERLERNEIDHPEVETEDTGKLVENQSPLNEGVEIDSQMKEKEDSPVLIESGSSDLQSGIKNDLQGETINQTIVEISDESETLIDSIAGKKKDGTVKEDSTNSMDSVPGKGDKSTLAPEVIKPSNDLEGGNENVEQAANRVSSVDSSSTSVREKEGKPNYASDQKKGGESMKTESHHNNLRSSQDEDK